MRITTSESLGVKVLTCHGTMLLGGGAEELAETFARTLRDPGRGVVLDLTQLNYMDSAAVGTVVACSKQAAVAGTVMKIALAAAGPVRRIFEVTPLERGSRSSPTPRPRRPASSDARSDPRRLPRDGVRRRQEPRAVRLAAGRRRAPVRAAA